MFASPLLTALLAVGERAGWCRWGQSKAARERMLPILQQTLANYARLGAQRRSVVLSLAGMWRRSESTLKCYLKFRNFGKSTLLWLVLRCVICQRRMRIAEILNERARTLITS